MEKANVMKEAEPSDWKNNTSLLAFIIPLLLRFVKLFSQKNKYFFARGI